MADPDYKSERGSLNGIYFILGAVVVALAVVLWFVLSPASGTSSAGQTGADAAASVTVQTDGGGSNDAGSTDASQGDTGGSDNQAPPSTEQGGSSATGSASGSSN